MKRSTNHLDGFNMLPIKTTKIVDADGGERWKATATLSNKIVAEKIGSSEERAIIECQKDLRAALMQGKIQ